MMCICRQRRFSIKTCISRRLSNMLENQWPTWSLLLHLRYLFGLHTLLSLCINIMHALMKDWSSICCLLYNLVKANKMSSWAKFSYVHSYNAVHYVIVCAILLNYDIFLFCHYFFNLHAFFTVLGPSSNQGEGFCYYCLHFIRKGSKVFLWCYLDVTGFMNHDCMLLQFLGVSCSFCIYATCSHVNLTWAWWSDKGHLVWETCFRIFFLLLFLHFIYQILG